MDDRTARLDFEKTPIAAWLYDHENDLSHLPPPPSDGSRAIEDPQGGWLAGSKSWVANGSPGKWLARQAWLTLRGIPWGVSRLWRAMPVVQGDEPVAHCPDATLNWMIHSTEAQLAEAQLSRDVSQVRKLRTERLALLQEAQELARSAPEEMAHFEPSPGALGVLLVGALLGSILATASWWLSPWYGVPLFLVALGLFGRATRAKSEGGSSSHGQLTDGEPRAASREPSEPPHRLTPDSVTRAFFRAGTVRSKEERVAVSDVVWEANGESCLVEFPEGITAEDALKARVKVAAFYGTSRNRVILTPDEDHEGKLKLHLCETDPLRGAPLLTPLLGRGRTSIFSVLPFGLDITEETVTFTWLWTNWLVGAVPRQGKSATGRHMVLTACLDYDVLPYTFDPQGLGIWEPFSKIGAYVGGRTQEALTETRKILGDLVDRELPRRQRVVQKYRETHKGVIRESKVTQEIISDRSLRCPWLLLAFDECDFYMQDQEISHYIDELTRRGPAFGISVLLMTQKPDHEVVPTMIRDNIAGRFCLCVSTPESNDMILGGGSAKLGYNATMLKAGQHVGAGWLKFEDEYRLCRSFYADDAQAAEVIEDCYDLRREFRPEILPDYEDPTTPGAKRDVQILLDIVAVFRELEADAMATKFIRQRLFTTFPERYALMGAHLPPLLHPFGISVTQLDCLYFDGMKYTSGIQLSQVLAALRQEGVDTEGL